MPNEVTEAMIEQLRDGEWWQTVVRGSNPTGFSTDQTAFVQSVADVLAMRAADAPPVEAVERVDTYLFKWVERGLFDDGVTANEALEIIAYHPTAPWNNGRWDVDHKPYAAMFYAAFPKALLARIKNEAPRD